MPKRTEELVNPAIVRLPLGYQEANFDHHGRLNSNLRLVGLELDDLIVKKTLDIGSGHDNFGSEARKHDLDVTSVDFDYYNPEAHWRLIGNYRDEPQFRDLIGTSALAAVAENLPFKDGSFDLVLAIRSVPEYSVSYENALRAIESMIRVLKKNGQLRIFPFIIDPSIVLNIRRGIRNQVYQQAFSRFENFNKQDLRKVLNAKERKILRQIEERGSSVQLSREKDSSLLLLIVTKG